MEWIVSTEHQFQESRTKMSEFLTSEIAQEIVTVISE